METGDRIKRARKKSGLTQKQLGESLGVSAAMIAQYETGVRNPKFETLQKIANILCVSVTDLIESISIGPMTEDDINAFEYFERSANEMDNYVHEIGEFLYYNPEHRALFDASMEVKQKDVKLATELLNRINGKSLNDHSDE